MEDAAIIDASLSNQGNGENAEGTVATSPTWMEQLESDLKVNKDLSQFKSISELGKTYIDLKGKSNGSIKLPGENATEAEILTFRQAMGIPVKPEDYKFERPTLPEGIPYDEGMEKTFRETAIKLNMTPQQVQGIYKMFNDYELNMHNEANKNITENREKSVNALKDIWKGDDFVKNVEETKRAFRETLKTINMPESLGGADAVIKEFDESGFGDHPAMIYFFNNLYQKISDDKFIKGDRSVSGGREPGMLDFSKSMPNG
jgi:hypothetical protein